MVDDFESYLDVRPQPLAHVKLLVAVWKVADEFRVGMVIKMGAEVVLQECVKVIIWEASMKAQLTMHENSLPQNSQG